MTLSHCVVVRTFLDVGVSSAAGGSTDGGPAAVAASAFFSWSFAMIISASAAFCFCASRASLVFSAIALPAATRLGFFGLMIFAGAGEVTCLVESTAAESTGCCISVMVYN